MHSPSIIITLTLTRTSTQSRARVPRRTHARARPKRSHAHAHMSAFTVSASASAVATNAFGRRTNVRGVKTSTCAIVRGTHHRGLRGSALVPRTSAADAGDAFDPYKTLGVKPDADAMAVKRAYNSKQLLYKGETDKLATVERAYEQILQAGLSARLAGKGPSDASIRFADRVRGSKWMPRPCPSPMKDVAVNFGLTLGCAAVTLVTPPAMRTLQVTIFAALLMVFRFFVKLVDVDPGPNAVLDPVAAQKHNNARFARSFGVVLGTFVVTLFCTFWLPQFFIEVLGLTVPAWVMLHQEVFVSTACGVVLGGLVSFYR